LRPNVDCSIHRQALKDRVEVARRLVTATEKPISVAASNSSTSPSQDISREVRGMAILLLFAAYENLLKTVSRTLLEEAAKSRARAQNLKPGFRLFLAHGELVGLLDSGRRKIWKSSGLKILSAVTERPARELDKSLFPDDGSFMKSSQVVVFCDVFDFGHPGPILREAWDRIDNIVDQRNGIAHGRLTPEEVGRNYSHSDLLKLIDLWETRWEDFLGWIESHCKGTKFYLAKQ
jgi:hypothetical protein